ncbi:fatty acyl-AMP ligase [Kitasatospora sp. NPDC051170]|uniref:fatty acyl-AMP ligase n=1 Tax=Kitasatospora sp. NPDC051170 TaxID=3364056 RepID=UPI0037A02555
MTGFRNFAEQIQARAAEAPGREALILLPEYEGRSQAEAVSYRALDAGARRLAGWLQDRGAAGERVLLAHSDRRLFAISLLACLYAGAIAVPTAPPRGRGHHAERIAGIVKDAAPCLALTDAAEAPDLSRLLAAQGHGSIPCLAADVVPPSAPFTAPRLGPDSVALLQYTSGSTREPRGVVVTHGSLTANQRAIGAALRTGPADVFGGWLPFHHDLGLIGQLLHPLWLGATSVLLTPEAFVKRPLRWLEAISRYGVTVSAAPDFAYDLCVRRTDEQPLPAGLDLSAWRAAVDGGEPIRSATWQAFSERFAPAGFRAEALTAGYGLAEATLLVALDAGGAAGARTHREVDAAALERNRLADARTGRPSRSLVPVGLPVELDLRIVDPQSQATLPDGRIGEIWVRGQGVAAGYWRRRGESAQTFGQTTAEGEGGYLRTGDLGVVQDGLLHVTGRLKDVIVVAGRNLYPQDLEQTVQRVSAMFGSATAFGVPGEREQVVVIQELRAQSRYRVDFAGLTAAVKDCLAREFELQTGAVLLVRPGTVRRTTSGKVERAAMRKLFLDGRLKPLHQEVKSEVEQLLVRSRP